jgi:hypothetical protein
MCYGGEYSAFMRGNQLSIILAQTIIWRMQGWTRVGSTHGSSRVQIFVSSGWLGQEIWIVLFTTMKVKGHGSQQMALQL